MTDGNPCRSRSYYSRTPKRFLHRHFAQLQGGDGQGSVLHQLYHDIDARFDHIEAVFKEFFNITDQDPAIEDEDEWSISERVGGEKMHVKETEGEQTQGSNGNEREKATNLKISTSSWGVRTLFFA